MKRAASLVVLALAAACEPPDASVSTLTGVRNVCDRDAVCGADATCVDRVCLALPPLAIDDLVAVITPTPLSGFPARPFLVPLDVIGSQRTFFEGRDDEGAPRWLKLPDLVETRFRVGLSEEYLAERPSCATDVRAEITLVPQAAIASGLPVSELVSSTRDSEGRVGLLAQRGAYDVYVRGLSGDPQCPTPPFLLRGFVDQANVLLPPPDRLAVTLRTPPGVSFAGFVVEVIDGGSGRRLSLPSFVGPAGEVDVLFSRPVQVDPMAPPGPPYWLRVSPPADVVAPTFAWDATLLESGGSLDLESLSLKTVKVKATLERGVSAERVAGHVYASSLPASGSTTSLLGIPPGVLAAYSAEVPADGEGFELSVPQGVFQLVGAARDPRLALGGAKLEARVSGVSDVLAGAVLSAPPLLRVAVVVRPPVGSAEEIVVEAVPRGAAKGPFDAVFSADVPVPRPAQAHVDADGVATLALDPGTYDFVARFDARTQYARAVAPDVAVTGDTTIELSVPLPFEVRGRVLTPAAGDASTPEEELPPLAGGAVRVFGRRAASARYLELSSGELDEAGRFRVFLPSRVGL